MYAIATVTATTASTFAATADDSSEKNVPLSDDVKANDHRALQSAVTRATVAAADAAAAAAADEMLQLLLLLRG